MSDRQRISGVSPYEGKIGFCRAVRVGNHIFVSGTAPIDEDGRTACPGDAYGQAHRVIDIIEDAIRRAGGTLQDVVRTRIFISERANFGPVCRAHGERFGEIRPAATMVVAQLLEPEWLVEIEAEAVIEDNTS
ncbi:MAG: RidA family protein [Armatimonadetes bacterium]|nr:RidA family protein [Armatimonadota bacterium]NOG92677.1 RidA family protein [Armatimonadota bacterium]